MNVLITGTSRGIGFALVKEFLASGADVYAVARSTKSLLSLQSEFKNKLHLIEADVSQPEGVKKVAAEIAAVGSLDTLINNAGVLKKDDTVEDFKESFNVNAITPFLMTKALMPYLMKSKEPRVAQISTLMSSIEDNSSGGYYSYRSSKSALNMITKSLSIDHPKVRFALIHPGWVKTEMGGSEAPTETTESARGIRSVIQAMDLKNTGAFKDFRGQDLAW